jgi:two-component system sensor histidine kinase/response regulator
MKTILLIDDEESIRSVFGLALRHHGYRVIEAEAGAIGVQMARKYLPDLILTDISMPGADGQAVLQQIRQDPELSTKQVVMMTGQTHLVTPRKGMEAGADDFLVKPISMEALLNCVEARLKRAQVHWRVEDRILARLQTSLHSTLPHEFFTPLGGVIGLIEILRSGFKTFSPQEIEDMLNDLHKSALRLHRSLRNYLLILDLQSNPSEGAAVMTERLEPQKLNEGLQTGIGDALRRNGREKDAVVEIEESTVMATASDITLIAEELVDNACKFSSQGTQIKVHFSRDGVLTVADLGRGMSAEEIEQIGAFQQFDRKKHEQQGLGLGLILVQKLIAKCGGRLMIESELTKGTRIKVVFLTEE